VQAADRARDRPLAVHGPGRLPGSITNTLL